VDEQAAAQKRTEADRAKFVESLAFNEKIIAEFRENGGVVGQPFEGAPILLLTTTGAKSGAERTNPLVYLPDGDRYVVCASAGGAPKNPSWYHNLVAHPQAIIEVGTEKFPVAAEIVSEPERTELYARQAAARPGFADYEKATSRVIPVVALTRI
jgi:deazaflavin-dependent oxidoreductase (nitroreductase family)